MQDIRFVKTVYSKDIRCISHWLLSLHYVSIHRMLVVFQVQCNCLTIIATYNNIQLTQSLTTFIMLQIQVENSKRSQSL